MRKHFFTTLLTGAFLFIYGTAFAQTSNVIFEEHFDVSSFPDCDGKFAPFANIISGNGTTTYTYAPQGNDPGYNWQNIYNVSGNFLSCGNNNYACDINEEEYAIVKDFRMSWWCARPSTVNVKEHTTDGTTNSGAMLVNASSNSSQYFYTLTLNGLCPDTQYEFSAYYVSIAADSENPSNITFQIYESTNMNTPIALGNTGDFGGTAGGSYNWRKYTLSFSTPSSSSPTTSYVLRLKNNRGDASGNDLMIDDITVVKYSKTFNLYEAGTTNTSKNVCTDGNMNATVTFSAADISLISGTGTVYAQLMKSLDNINWAAEGSMQQQTGAGTLSFSLVSPTTTGDTFYYRVKLSADAARAQNIELLLETEHCYNDMITQTFNLKRVGSSINVNIDNMIVCGNDESVYTITVSPTGNPQDLYPTSYNIQFDAKGIAAGFPSAGIQGNFNGGNTIQINIPNSIYPDNYVITLTFDNALSECGSVTYTETMKVLYSANEIMEQKWDDVIALLKAGSSMYAGYQWYKNDAVMAGENKSYLYLAPQKLNSADCYQVLISRTDGTSALSCCFNSHAPLPQAEIPFIIQGGSQHIRVFLAANATARLWTVTGVLVSSQVITTDDYELFVPHRGMYLLEIITDKAEKKVFPIVR